MHSEWEFNCCWVISLIDLSDLSDITVDPGPEFIITALIYKDHVCSGPAANITTWPSRHIGGRAGTCTVGGCGGPGRCGTGSSEYHGPKHWHQD